jgi:hypothetical protein
MIQCMRRTVTPPPQSAPAPRAPPGLAVIWDCHLGMSAALCDYLEVVPLCGTDQSSRKITHTNLICAADDPRSIRSLDEQNGGNELAGF